MSDLAGYLNRAAREPFAWGTRDCALFVADWVQEVRGIDPAAHLRGRYADRDTSMSLHSRLGLVGTVRQCARSAGLPRINDPVPGDIAVIRGDFGLGDDMVCAIRTHLGWAVRSERVVSVIPTAHVVAAWRVLSNG